MSQRVGQLRSLALEHGAGYRALTGGGGSAHPLTLLLPYGRRRLWCIRTSLANVVA